MPCTEGPCEKEGYLFLRYVLPVRFYLNSLPRTVVVVVVPWRRVMNANEYTWPVSLTLPSLRPMQPSTVLKSLLVH